MKWGYQMARYNIKEIWKDIKGYEGLYQISNYGNLKSLDRKVNVKNNFYRISKGKIIKSTPQTNNYLRATLCKKNKKYDARIHRLVAEHFIKNPFNKPYINHKDFNKRNNYFNNLEWVAPKENDYHAFLNGKKYRLRCKITGKFIKGE